MDGDDIFFGLDSGELVAFLMIPVFFSSSNFLKLDLLSFFFFFIGMSSSLYNLLSKAVLSPFGAGKIFLPTAS